MLSVAEVMVDVRSCSRAPRAAKCEPKVVANRVLQLLVQFLVDAWHQLIPARPSASTAENGQHR
jgi:hypothetical protein